MIIMLFVILSKKNFLTRFKKYFIISYKTCAASM